jgi:hypothetical protein
MKRCKRSTPKGFRQPKGLEDDFVVESYDTRLRFCLTHAKSGVYVERIELRATGVLAHAAVFTKFEEFASFCDTDDLRFEYQLTFIQLRKKFEELFDVREVGPQSQGHGL